MTPDLSLAPQSHWDCEWSETSLGHDFSPNFLRAFLVDNIPRGSGDALEIGCFPGGILSLLGDLGYRLNGIDLTPRVDKLAHFFKAKGYRTGSITRGDFFSLALEPRFEVVCSLGFVEHFPDWAEVTRRHCAMVAPGGTLIIAFPNFAGLVQHTLHAWLDAEDLAIHHLPAMDVAGHAAVCRENGFTVPFAGYFKGFHFWSNTPRLPFFKRAVYKGIRTVMPLLEKLPSHKSWSPYGAVVARKS
jgi:L-malate glycosyltransferase